MSHKPLDDERAAYIASIGEAAGIFADSAWRREKSLARCSALVRKVGLLLDREIEKLDELGQPTVACKAGCDACCHRRVFVSVPEVAAIASRVAELEGADQAAMAMGLADYADAVASGSTRPACPLLKDSLCTVYDIRPMSCRGVNSLDVSSCDDWLAKPDADFVAPQRYEQRLLARAVGQGLRAASGFHGLGDELVDLGLTLKQVFEDVSLLGAYFQGDNPFASKPKGEEMVSPNDARFRLPTDPTGYIEPDPAVQAYHKLMDDDGDTARAIEALKDADPTVAGLFSITVPRMYASEDEIAGWLERWDQALDRFEESQFDPRMAYNALGGHLTFDLAYHGRDVRPRLSRLGDLIFDRITSVVLPDLTAPIEGPRKPGPLRVGYISYALRNHNGSKWALGWLQNHGEEIETYAFNLYHAEDFITARFRESASHYFQLTCDIPQAARFIRSLDLDVLIFTDLGMCGMNTQYASLRLARHQCTAWGHPVTSGLPTVDTYLSSELMEPANGDDHYRETLVRLPNSGLCLNPVQRPAVDATREQFGLPDGFLPILAQNLMKCLPRWDYLFKEINDRIGGPIAVLKAISSFEQRVIQERFERAGIEAIWIPRLHPTDFRRLLQLCDVSLDPPAWNGGNTTVETMGVGVPVVTLPTEFMRGRHSLAFHTMAGAGALIARSPEEYVELATDRERLRSAMEQVEMDGVYNDRKPAAALDRFFHEVSGV